MHILVTGARGFVGTRLVQALSARGSRVTASSRGHAMVAGAAATLRLETLFNPRALEGFDAIIHLAALAHRRAPARLYGEVNVELTRRLARAAHEAGVGRFVFASSVKAAADETRGAPLNERSPEQPLDAYGRSKLDAERALAEISGLASIALRLPLVHAAHARANFRALLGMADTPAPLPFGDFDNRRNVISLTSAIEALIAAATRPLRAQRVFFVADQPALSTAAMVMALREGFAREPRLFSIPGTHWAIGRSPFRMLAQSLEVDDSAFRRTFGYGDRQGVDSYVALRDAAREYARRHGPASSPSRTTESPILTPLDGVGAAAGHRAPTALARIEAEPDARP